MLIPYLACVSVYQQIHKAIAGEGCDEVAFSNSKHNNVFPHK